jgi:anti-sigma regulatory factor (Ser/Thr protein kinase)
VAGLPKKRAASLIALIAAGTLAGLIALVQLLPFFEFIPFAWTYHTGDFGPSHLPLRGMLTATAAGFYGSLDAARNDIPLIFLMPYLGTIPGVLAVTALLRPGRKGDIFFSTVLVIGAGILLGLPPFRYIAGIPGLDHLTFIKYLQPLIAFACAMLAGRTLDEARQGRGQLRLALSAAVVLILLMASSALLDRPYPHLWRFMNGATLLASVLSLTFLAITFTQKWKKRTCPAAAAILILILIDLLSASLANKPFMSENMARKDLSALRALEREEPLARFAGAEDVLLPNQNLLVPLSDLGISDALIIKESKNLFQWLYSLSAEDLERSFLQYHSLRPGLACRPEAVPIHRAVGGPHYLLSRLPLPTDQSLDRIMERGRLLTVSPAHTFKTLRTIGNDTRPALFAHPPCRWSVASADLGLAPALNYLVNEFNPYFEIKQDFDLGNLEHFFPKEAQIIIFRIFQESLTNIAKHAQARKVYLAIRESDGNVILEVEDDGRGFEVAEALNGRPTTEKGLGLAALNERAKMLGGSLKINSQKGRGTHITCAIQVDGNKDLPGRTRTGDSS